MSRWRSPEVKLQRCLNPLVSFQKHCFFLCLLKTLKFALRWNFRGSAGYRSVHLKSIAGASSVFWSIPALTGAAVSSEDESSTKTEIEYNQVEMEKNSDMMIRTIFNLHHFSFWFLAKCLFWSNILEWHIHGPPHPQWDRGVELHPRAFKALKCVILANQWLEEILNT